MLHSDVQTMLPNQEVPFLSESDLPIEEEQKIDLQELTCTKRDVGELITMAETHRLVSHAVKHNVTLLSDFDTLFTMTKNQEGEQFHSQAA